MVTGDAEVTIGVVLAVNRDGAVDTVKPLFKRTANGPSYVPAKLPDGSTCTISRMKPNREDKSKSTVDISVTSPAGSNQTKTESLVVEASIKPYINLVWMGTVTLVVGFALTIARRVQEAREKD
jgi:cytochrome c-type biogenesis protein CcmF